MKVYCKNCKYLKNIDYGFWSLRICKHPNNLELIDKPYSQEIHHPEIDIVNKNNDCKLFKEKMTLIKKLKKII